MVGVALPWIDADLGLSTSTLQWVVSGYVLGYGGLLLLGGRAADLLGRRRVLLVGPRRVRGRLAARRPRRRRHAADRHAVHQGHGRGVHRAGRPVDHHHHVRRGTGPQPGAGHLHRHRRERLLARPGLRRPAHRVGWRWTFLLPVPVAIVLLVAACACCCGRSAAERGRAATTSPAPCRHRRDAALVFGVAGAPEAGWTSAQTIARSSRAGCWRRVHRGRARVAHPWSGWASCARRPIAGQPRRDGGLRLLRRLPVHRHAVHAVVARLVGAGDGARVPAGRPHRGVRRPADRRR